MKPYQVGNNYLFIKMATIQNSYKALAMHENNKQPANMGFKILNTRILDCICFKLLLNKGS